MLNTNLPPPCTDYGLYTRTLAALEPRFLGGTAIITRSFARIHETIKFIYSFTLVFFANLFIFFLQT